MSLEADQPANFSLLEYVTVDYLIQDSSTLNTFFSTGSCTDNRRFVFLFSYIIKIGVVNDLPEYKVWHPVDLHTS